MTVKINDKTVNGILTYTGGPACKIRYADPAPGQSDEDAMAEAASASLLWHKLSCDRTAIDDKLFQLSFNGPSRLLTEESDDPEVNKQLTDMRRQIAQIEAVMLAIEKRYSIVEYIKLWAEHKTAEHFGEHNSMKPYVHHPHLNIN